MTGSQEDAVKNCIEKLNALLMCATKKRPDGPPTILGSFDPQAETKKQLKGFLAENLAKQLIQRGMKDITDYELHKLVYAIAQKTFLDDGSLVEPPKYPPLPSPPPRNYHQQDSYQSGSFFTQGYKSSLDQPGPRLSTGSQM